MINVLRKIIVWGTLALFLLPAIVTLPLLFTKPPSKAKGWKENKE